MVKHPQLAELQLAIMHVLWTHGESSVADVRERLLPDRDLAYTTVGTMLAKLEEKGFVRHHCKGRQNIYRAAVKRDKVSQSMVTDLVERLFHGDVTKMVSQLLGGGQVTPETIKELKKIIRNHEKEL